ncbi:MAG: hypothetical protein MSA89_11035 [Clostridium sp.]|nr:hypothetical protein [Clostridium sp.]MCI7443594.1 hypothetical protein [Clostridium sp.]
MKPYVEEFIVDKMKEYNKKISQGSFGSYKIVKKEENNNIIEGYLYKREGNKEFVIELLKDNNLVMKLNHKEIESTFQIIKFAKGRVGIVGLGLGYVAQEIAKNQDVKEIIVYEISKEIIELYKNNFGENKKIKIIEGDAFKAESQNFDYFYVDIYNYVLSSKVVDDYKFFMKLHNIEEYVFCGLEHFLLSCSYEEIIWVYIPETWMDMAKEISIALSISGYIKGYEQLDKKIVSNVLAQFKEVFNEEL